MSREIQIDRATCNRLVTIGCTSVIGGGYWWRSSAGGYCELAEIHDRAELAAGDIAYVLGLRGWDARRAVEWMAGSASVKTKTGYVSMDVLGPNGERVTRAPDECKEMIYGK